MSRLTFWLVPQRPPIVIDGYQSRQRPLAFSPDGKWLATSSGAGQLRLWALPGSGSDDVRVLKAPATVWSGLAFDPKGRYLFAVGTADCAWIVPLDGSPGRKLDEYSKDTLLMGAAVSPTGRHVATAFGYGQGPKTLRVWDVETGKVRLFELPVPPPPEGNQPLNLTGYEGGGWDLAFLDESTLFTAGDGGIHRRNLDTGRDELILPAPGLQYRISISSDRHELLFCKGGAKKVPGPVSCGVMNLSTGVTRSLGQFADASSGLMPIVTSEGSAFALLGRDGSVRVGLRSGGEPHWLLGHAGMPDQVAISPDLRWVASTGEDNTLRLWPMPDLSKPPLHTLQHDELVAKLSSLTNLRAVRDPASSTGWKIDLGPFPGWKNIPTWQP